MFGCPRAPVDFKLNGRTLEDYFPNKVHQQLIKAPLVLVDRAESFDIVPCCTVADRPDRQARCVWPSPVR